VCGEYAESAEMTPEYTEEAMPTEPTDEAENSVPPEETQHMDESSKEEIVPEESTAPSLNNTTAENSSSTEQTQPTVDETAPAATLPTEFPAIWRGEGTVSYTYDRLFELTVSGMSETYISGYLIVTKPGEAASETDFTKPHVASTGFSGIGVTSGNTIVYTITFTTPVTVGVIPTFTYDQLELVYSKENNTFSFDFVFCVTMYR
jgi:hypothetical protein